MKTIKGFTLVELLILLVVIAVVAAVGIPNFNQMIRHNRVTSYSNAVLGALNLARSTAVQRGDSMAVCGSSNGAACDGNWSAGWLVFVDPNGDAPGPATPADVIRVGEAPPALDGSTNGGLVRYSTRGVLGDGGITRLQVAYADCQAEGTSVITLASGGRSSAERQPC